MEKYNVYIVSVRSGKAESLIGSNLTEERAEKRVTTGLMQINKDNYFVGEYLVGGKEDIKFGKDVKMAKPLNI